MLHRFLRPLAWLAAILVLLAGCAWLYYLSLGIDKIPKPNTTATVADLDFMRAAVQERRGKILAIVTSAATMPGGKKKAGYELTELSRAWYVFMANGYEVDIASPLGGTPPVRIDTDDMGDADYAFLNDRQAQAEVAASRRLADIDPADYAAVYIVGGKGAMIDLPRDPNVRRIVAAVAAQGVVGAVCHGPAALFGVTGADGKPLLSGRRVTGFSNAEERFFGEEGMRLLPFLLEDRAVRIGAHYSATQMFLDHTVVDGRIVTGQNPWSTWSTAEGMIRALGHVPVPRVEAAEEASVRLLATYYRDGYRAARAQQKAEGRFDKMLLLMHALVAGMEWRPDHAFQLQRLANQ
jgi:putative intracellular protease/amidase